ncbi:MAG TPA: FAD-dependent monooxygenase, partial [Dermatophilaceae bacterium]|nr:FAD-dependent monooxygenase [Dermatophilaceae bacterium]
MTNSSADVPRQCDVLVIGGGPAGSLLACLLVRRGLAVTLVEKQTELARDFRGETIAAPSVITLRSLGFGPELERHGYLETRAVNMSMEGRKVFRVDYSRFGLDALPIDIPQPALIGIFNDAARVNPGYTHLTGTTFTDLVRSGDAVTGATVRLADGTSMDIAARLVVGADGRFSKVRASAQLAAKIVPMERDFEWFKLPRPADWGTEADLMISGGRHLVVLPTFPNWLRIGHNVPKGQLGNLRAAGFDAFKQGIIDLDPRLADLVHENLHSWHDTSFLDIFTAELPQWSRDGLLLIGDASHTCTPILGQGVNLGLQDAVTFAPVIARSLAGGRGPIGASSFAAAQDARRKHKRVVTK